VLGKEKTPRIFIFYFPSSLATQVLRMNRWIVSVFSALLLLTWSCKSGQEKLLILHAGSLSVPFKHISEAFMDKYPEILVYTEAAGSRTCARKITELNVPADVMASADSSVIRQLLMPHYADFCIDFALNEMVIMYTERSLEAEKITDRNWPEILLKPQVQYGHSDPHADPCGYRTLLCWQLAESYYCRPGLYDLLVQSRPLKNIRPKEVDLLALLESGELDYIFIYRSVAEQHHGLYLVLPDEINLKTSDMSEYYQQAWVELEGAMPGEKIIRKGAPMVYGITIPKTARSPRWASRFVAFVLGPEGQRIMKSCGQPLIVPARVDHLDALPELLKPLVQN
jgi:molybdate/tungstate transport system substrate-binding protein